MNLENATKLMETDSIVLFDEQLIKKNVKIKTLQRGKDHEQTQNKTRKSY